MNSKRIPIKSILHKYYYVRKVFVAQRYERHTESLMYQPKRLREVCERYTLEALINAIEKAVEQRRENYFAAFLNELGEKQSQGGWSKISFSKR